ncbi:MAG: SGNH/GDSL hydrolase family protein [Candidatus Scalinduaceae bacterium]
MGKFFTNFALFTISIVFTVLILEIALSAYSHFFYPRLSISDETLGWKYKPTQKMVTRHFSTEITYDLYINKDGFRDEEFTVDENYYKIMVLGDSMTFGLEASQDKIFSSLLEKKLKGVYVNNKIDVMNFGITGFGTGQELISLKKYGAMYNPDVVIIMLFEINDFDDNTSIISGGRYTPHFRVKNDELVYHNSPDKLQEALTYLSDVSVLCHILSNRLGITKRMLSKKYIMSEQDKMLLMHRIMDEIHNYTEAKEVPLFIFYIKRNGTGDEKFRSIRQYCINNDIFFRAIPLLAAERVGGNGHWNSKGHNSVAEIIYNELSKSKVLDNLAE